MRLLRARSVLSSIACVTVGAAIVLSCGEHEGKLRVDGAGGSGTQAGSDSGGMGMSAGASEGGTAASPSDPGAGAPNAESGGGGTEGGAPPLGNDPGGAASSDGGTTSAAGGATNTPSSACVYFTEALDAPPETETGSSGAGGQGTEPEAAGAGGAGGAGPEYTITVLKNSFVGHYLADSVGKALYVYGADYPGDCDHAPVTNCYNDCALAWPIFEAGPRVLPDGLEDSLFGSIERTDGLVQATYRGWPLYHYKNDLAPGDVIGHARGLWHLAEVVLPNIVIIRIETQRVLADEFGHTLYVFAEDALGSESADPNSACVGGCLDEFKPFMLRHFSPVSYLEAANFSVFVRADGIQQIAYKGAPLYWSNADARSGEMNGTATTGWTVAVP